ncbi:MAG: hypothetical protein AABX02_00295 [archaeon]
MKMDMKKWRPREAGTGKPPSTVFPQFEVADQDVKARLAKLEAYDTEFLEKKLLHDGTFSTKQESAQAMREFKRFIALHVMHEKAFGMINPKVDAIWHAFILYTREYSQFCEATMGSYLHHVPCGPTDGGDQDALERDCEAFRSAYRDAFGEIPQMIEACCSGNCSSASTP